MNLTELIEWARGVKMTPEQEREQRISWAYGNCAIENPLVTREMVEATDKEMNGIDA